MIDLDVQTHYICLLDEIIKMIDLSRFPLPITLKVVQAYGFHLHITMISRNRDTNQSITVEQRSSFPPYVEFKSRYEIQRIIEWIKDQILLAIKHELEEHFLFNGKRVFDPHAPERRERDYLNYPEVPDQLVKQVQKIYEASKNLPSSQVRPPFKPSGQDK